MNFSVKLSTKSKIDLLNIKIYISSYDYILSDYFINSLLDSLEKNLELFPYMYREYFKNIRFIPYKWYIVLYKIDENKKEVIILRIIHWSKDLNNLKI